MNINLETWNQLESDVGQEVMPMIVNQFIQELADRSAKLIAAISNKDITSIAEEAHTIKSTARTVGLDEVSNCAAVTERLGREQQADSAMQSATQLTELCQAGVRVLGEKLENLA